MRASVAGALSPCPILLSLALAACSRTPRADGPAADTPAAGTPAGADTVGLVGPVWRLVEFRGGDDTRLTPDDPARYTIEFKSDGSLGARIDCNRGRGTWKSSGPGLELGPLALTRAACPPGSLHDRIVKHWPYIRSYVLKDGHLHLSLMADGGIYEFEPSPDTAPHPAQTRSEATLENTYWKATAIGDRPVRVDQNLSEPHLLLNPAETQASGSTGCNGFSGSYQLSGDSLRFGDLVSTLRACVDPELNRQERAFLDALGATRTWRVTGDTLVLSGETAPLARFTAQ
jgi:heat shock protein HslJ